MSAEFDQDPPNYTGKILLGLALVAVALVAYFVWQYSQPEPAPKVVNLPPPVPQTPVEQQPTPEVVEEQTAPEVVEQEETRLPPEPLPSLDQSDNYTLNKLAALPNSEALLKLIIPDNILLKFVRGVMSLDEGIVVHEYRSVQSPTSDFKVRKIDEPLDIDVGQRYSLDPANFDRYKPWVNVFAAADKPALAQLYLRAYPLLEQAYEQHGVDRGGFHHVMLEVIDELLAAPVMEGDVILIQPKVYFQYQDPALEKSPEAHRLLIRMGPDNTRKVQAGLRELKTQLQALPLKK